jgi:hypothetical protein
MASFCQYLYFFTSKACKLSSKLGVSPLPLGAGWRVCSASLSVPEARKGSQRRTGTQFTCFTFCVSMCTGTRVHAPPLSVPEARKGQPILNRRTGAAAALYSIYLLYSCFTSTKAQILTQKALKEPADPPVHRSASSSVLNLLAVLVQKHKY